MKTVAAFNTIMSVITPHPHPPTPDQNLETYHLEMLWHHNFPPGRDQLKTESLLT